MGLYKNRYKGKSITIAVALGIIILIAVVVWHFITTKDKEEDTGDGDVIITTSEPVEDENEEEETSVYTAVFEIDDGGNSTIVDEVVAILNERMADFGMEGDVYVSDKGIGVSVNATDKQKKYLKYLGTPGKLSMRTDDGKVVFDYKDIETVSVKTFTIEGELVNALSVKVKDEYREKLAKATKEAIGSNFSLIFDEQLLLNAPMANEVKSGKIVLTGIDDDIMEAISILSLSEPLPKSLKVSNNE